MAGGGRHSRAGIAVPTRGNGREVKRNDKESEKKREKVKNQVEFIRAIGSCVAGTSM